MPHVPAPGFLGDLPHNAFLDLMRTMGATQSLQALVALTQALRWLVSSIPSGDRQCTLMATVVAISTNSDKLQRSARLCDVGNCGSKV